jgi:hypothetical protein
VKKDFKVEELRPFVTSYAVANKLSELYNIPIYKIKKALEEVWSTIVKNTFVIDSSLCNS